MKRTFFKIFFSSVFFAILFLLGCDDGFQQVRSAECTWNSDDVIFIDVSLDAPDCEEIELYSQLPHISTIVELFILFPNSSVLEWQSSSSLCSASTSKSLITTINTINDERWFSSGFTADESLTTGVDLSKIIGNLSLSVSGITNFATAESGSLVWRSSFTGEGLFHNLHFVKEAEFVPNSIYGSPIYINDQYVPF